jgi:type II secretory pathway component PulF
MTLSGPRTLRHQAAFYQRLGQMVSAGIGVTPAFEAMATMPADARERRILLRVLAQLARGNPTTQALRAAGFPDFDVDLVEAGERSGRLDVCFRLLADFYASRARISAQAIGQLIYPAILLHIGVFLFSVVVPFAQSQFTASLPGLGFRALGILAPFYLLFAAFQFVLAGAPGERARSLLESIFRRVPMLGSALYSLALARAATALEALLGAGVKPIEAWEIAARSSGSPELRGMVASWATSLQTGITPGQLLRGNPRIPTMFSALYATGETSGTLDESLRRLHAFYAEEGAHKLELFAKLVPRLIYLLVAFYLAFRLVKAYANYFEQIEEIWR